MDSKKLLFVAIAVLVGTSLYFAFSYPPRQTPAEIKTVRVSGEGERCGGNRTDAPVCAVGLHCVPVPGNRLPFGDVGGTCVKGSTSDSGIQGMVLLGPTCPMMRNPPDPKCADKPWETTLYAVRADKSRTDTKFYSKADGTFTVSLPAGDYTIRSTNDVIYPRCSSNGTITVPPDRYASTTVSCDTGIR